jgi:predicted nucleotidyltransferase
LDPISNETRTAEILSTLRRLSDQPEFENLDALMVGGSVGRGEANESSDLDLFVLVSPPDLQRFLETTSKALLLKLGDIMLQRGPVWVDNFGYSFTALYESGRVVQLNVNSCETLTSGPMRNQKHLMLFDKSGCYSSYLASPSHNHASSSSQIAHEAATFCMLRLIFVATDLEKRELWQAIRHLQEARDQLLLVIRVVCDCLPPWIDIKQPAKKIEQHMETLIPAELCTTLPQYSATSLSHAAIGIAAMLMNMLAKVADDNSLLPAFAKAQEILKQKLKEHLT